MAEKRTKTIRVGTSEQKDVTELLASFGWRLESAYDVYKEETPRSPGYHVVDIHVSCDPSRQNYTELTAFAKEYSNLFPDYPNEPGWPSSIIFAILASFFIGFFFPSILYRAVDYLGEYPVLFLALPVPVIVIFIVRKILYEVKFSDVYKKNDAFSGKREEILKQARVLEGNCLINFKRSTSGTEWKFLCRKIIRQIL
jgi:hypothetical protein